MPQKPSASPAAPSAATLSRASNSAARLLKLLLVQRNGGGRTSAAAASDLSWALRRRRSSATAPTRRRRSLSSAHDHDDRRLPTPLRRLRRPHPASASSAPTRGRCRSSNNPSCSGTRAWRLQPRLPPSSVARSSQLWERRNSPGETSHRACLLEDVPGCLR